MFYQNVEGAINRSIYMTNDVPNLEWHSTGQGVLRYANVPDFTVNGRAMIYFFYTINTWIFRYCSLSWQDEQIMLGEDYRGIFGDWRITQLI